MKWRQFLLLHVNDIYNNIFKSETGNVSQIIEANMSVINHSPWCPCAVSMKVRVSFGIDSKSSSRALKNMAPLWLRRGDSAEV